MAHPYQQHREHHVERERVSHIAGEHEGHRDYQHVYHRARGGGVHHADEAEDKAMVKHMVKPSALKAHGGHVKHRSDKPHRAKGGRVKKNKATVVNVNVAPQQPQHPPMMMPPPPAAAAPPPMPPRPPMGPPPGGPAGMPPGMPPHAAGGRVGYKKGGRVKRADGGSLAEKAAKANLREKMGGEPAFFGPLNRKLYGVPLKGKSQDDVNATMRGQMKEAEDISDAVPRKTGGPVEPHLKQGVGMGPSGKGMPKGKPVKLGKNAIYSPAKDAMGPTSGTGTGGAVARMEMSRRAGKYYHKTPPARHTP